MYHKRNKEALYQRISVKYLAGIDITFSDNLYQNNAARWWYVAFETLGLHSFTRVYLSNDRRVVETNTSKYKTTHFSRNFQYFHNFCYNERRSVNPRTADVPLNAVEAKVNVIRQLTRRLINNLLEIRRTMCNIIV